MKRDMYWGMFVMFIAIGAGLFFGLTQDVLYSGPSTKVSLSSSYILVVDSETASIEAAAPEFFLLRNDKGEAVSGKLTDPPPGWQPNLYFLVKSATLSQGNWYIVGENSVSVHVTGDKDTRIRVVYTPGTKGVLAFIMTLLALCVYLLFLILAPRRD